MSEKSGDWGSHFSEYVTPGVTATKSPRNPGCSKRATMKDSCTESFGFLGPDRCGERKKKGNTN